MLPGTFGSPESLAAKARLELELVTSPVAAPASASADGMTVAEVLVAFMARAERYYRDPDGKPGSEIVSIKRSIRPVRELYAELPAPAFGPKALAAGVADDDQLAHDVYFFLKAIGREERCGTMAPGGEITGPGLAGKKLSCLVEKLTSRWKKLVTSQRGSGGGYCLTLPPRTRP